MPLTGSSRSKHWLWPTLLLVLVALSVLVARLEPASLEPLISLRFPSVEWVDAETLSEWMELEPEDRPVLLDVRGPEEFEVSHLRGARRVDPDGSPVDSLAIPRHQKIVLYCSVGYRSGAIAEKLEDGGFDEVYNLEGGIFAWANEGRPVFRGDAPAELVHPYDAAWGVLLRKELRATPPGSE